MNYTSEHYVTILGMQNAAMLIDNTIIDGMQNFLTSKCVCLLNVWVL